MGTLNNYDRMLVFVFTCIKRISKPILSREHEMNDVLDVFNPVLTRKKNYEF